LESIIEKRHSFNVRVVESKENKPIKNVNVKVFRLETEPISLKQWGENLKTGTPFKCLILSINTDNMGNVTADLPEGTYETKVEKFNLIEVRELKQNTEILFVEPKKKWWQ
jgi:hypothetical protein